jgi:hypothetical protein
MKMLRAAVIGLAGWGAMAFAVASLRAADGRVAVDAAVDASGKLHVPNAYRTTYQYLGSWSAAKDQGPGAQEIHVVYASPGAIAAYRKDGHFPDGTVLVKEVYQAATAAMTTGTISHADTLRGWFVMVRDSKGRHAENEVWGDGWGWSWFDATDSKTASRSLPTKDGVPMPTFDYRANCKGCHAPAKASDWIYTQGYPPLKR